MVKPTIKSNLEEYERLFLSLGDKTRLKLLTLMAKGPVTVGFLVDQLGESQPKVSRHLAYLRNSGVVNTRREGKCIYYGVQRAGDPDLDRIVDLVIGTISGEVPHALANPARAQPLGDSRDLVANSSIRARRATIDEHDELELLPEPEAESVDYQNAYQETEIGEDSFEKETNDGELEVFLL